MRSRVRVLYLPLCFCLFLRLFSTYMLCHPFLYSSCDVWALFLYQWVFVWLVLPLEFRSTQVLYSSSPIIANSYIFFCSVSGNWSLQSLLLVLILICIVAYQNLRLIRPFPQCHLPKLKLISAEALPWHFTSLRLPWVSQWESALALESDDPRYCIFSRSAKNNLASRSRPPPSRLCYLLASSALCSP